MNKGKCYVCGHPVNPKQSVQVGSDLERHKDCKPGSATWMTTRGKNSDMSQYFRPEGDTTTPARPQKHPQHKNVKAFAGRVKYLWFMHERDKKDPEYHGVILHLESPSINAVAELLWDCLFIWVGNQEVPLEPSDTLISRIEDLL